MTEEFLKGAETRAAQISGAWKQIRYDAAARGVGAMPVGREEDLAECVLVLVAEVRRLKEALSRLGRLGSCPLCSKRASNIEHDLVCPVRGALEEEA